MSIDDIMEKAALEGSRVRVVDKSGNVYEGDVCSYIKGDDEEDGISTIGIAEDNSDDWWCLKENDIKSIEVLG